MLKNILPSRWPVNLTASPNGQWNEWSRDYPRKLRFPVAWKQKKEIRCIRAIITSECEKPATEIYIYIHIERLD